MTEFETRLKRIQYFCYGMIGLVSFLMLWRAFDIITIRQKFNGLQAVPFDWTNLVYFGLCGFIIAYLLIHISKARKLQSQVTWRE